MTGPFVSYIALFHQEMANRLIHNFSSQRTEVACHFAALSWNAIHFKVNKNHYNAILLA